MNDWIDDDNGDGMDEHAYGGEPVPKRMSAWNGGSYGRSSFLSLTVNGALTGMYVSANVERTGSVPTRSDGRTREATIHGSVPLPPPSIPTHPPLVHSIQHARIHSPRRTRRLKHRHYRIPRSQLAHWISL